EAGEPAGAAREVADLAATVAELEAAHRPRWLWPATAACYPRVLEAAGRVQRCHDIELTEALLLGADGRWGEPRGLGAAWARLVGAPVPTDPPPPAARIPGDGQGALFDSGPAPPATGDTDPLEALIRVYRHQQARIEAGPAAAGRFRLLVAAESAGALLAVEMGHTGLPWRVDVHDEILADLLGTASPVGGPPRRLAELAGRIAEAFGGQRIHPDSPAEVLRAFAREGISLPSTRAAVLRGVDHPAVPLLLEYKELHRIWTAHGWAWQRQWIRDGRFHPEYVPAGVVSGRWATRGGGALQIPKVVRRAVRADPDWRLVVADAGQLEPRILAAVSGDPAMMRAAGSGDMYAALAAEAFGGDRARAKVALLGAMYGQTGGQAVPALAALRRSYPVAQSYVEEAARTGEAGGLVRSWLGRTCPPGSVGWSGELDQDGDELDRRRGAGMPGGAMPGAGMAGAAARARGRFTRNFVIQATAAEWALVLLAALRRDLAGTGAELVFFQHDEVIVHSPAALAPEVASLIEAAGAEAGRLLFGATPVRFPLGLSIVDSYAEAK
ncbi:MAG: bifunctional 3'-5' exonuclease/DNA polymerase, partial [Micromonosporaceae bacterium]|nr:bifunctional 3'-5' exonuclease/DNA polymerase [Micromonosporaceae bacterium]